MELLEMLEGYALLDELLRSFDSKKEEAARIASEIITKYPRDYGLFSLAAFSLSKLRIEEKKFQDCLDLIRQIESNRPTETELDDYMTAELAFTEAQALEGIARARALGDLQTAEQNYMQASQYASRILNLPLARRVKLHLATLTRERGNHEQARVIFDELLAMAVPYEPEVIASALIQRTEIALGERDRSEIKKLLVAAMDFGWKAQERGVPDFQEFWKASTKILELATQC